MGFSPEKRADFERDLDMCPSPWEGKAMTVFVDHPKVSGAVIDGIRAVRKGINAHPRLRDTFFGIAEKVTNGAKMLGSDRIFESSEVANAPRPPRRVDGPDPNELFEATIETGEESPYHEAVHYLIGPSNFDRRGYVNQYRRQYSVGQRGSTSVLDSLTPDEIDGCQMLIRNVDDQHEDIPYEEILDEAKNGNNKVIVSFSGTQTNQYPRALHIATTLRAEAILRGLDDKIDILFGGFHIRGDEGSREEVMAHGFTVVNGEVEEGRLGNVLTDCVHDRVNQYYEWTDENGDPIMVDLKGNPLPAPCNDEIAAHQSIILQSGRGCPFNCSFCGVKAIDGRKLRSRSVEEVSAMLDHLVSQGITKVFLSDDNFYRNPNKMEILDLFIKHAQQGNKFILQMQSDIRVINGKNPDGSDKIDEDFMQKCSEAGVHSVFIGTESFDYDVLQKMGKNHNIKGGVEGFIKAMEAQRKAWNDHGIGVDFTCIIGNEYDKKGVGKRTAEIALRIGVNVVIPFILGVVPGSDDDKRFKEHPEIAEVNPDFNTRTTTFPTIKWNNPEALTPEEVVQEREDLIRTFYRPENIPSIYISPLTLRHVAWYMVQTALGNHGMDGGLGKVWFGEKFDEEKFQEDSTICRSVNKGNV